MMMDNGKANAAAPSNEGIATSLSKMDPEELAAVLLLRERSDRWVRDLLAALVDEAVKRNHSIVKDAVVEAARIGRRDPANATCQRRIKPVFDAMVRSATWFDDAVALALHEVGVIDMSVDDGGNPVG